MGEILRAKVGTLTPSHQAPLEGELGELKNSEVTVQKNDFYIGFVVPGTPVPKARPRFFARHGKIGAETCKRTIDYEKTVAIYARRAMHGRPPYSQPISIVITINIPIPKSWSKIRQEMANRREIMPTGRPDKDNYEKAIFDAMNGIVWLDDAQVVDSFTCKRYSRCPGIEVRVVPMSVLGHKDAINAKEPVT